VIEGQWQPNYATDCKSSTLTIDRDTISWTPPSETGKPDDLSFDMDIAQEDPEGANVFVYVLGEHMAKKYQLTFAMRISVQNGEMTFKASDDQSEYGAGIYEAMQPLRRCPS
jgi:hypothetical protein